MARLLADEQFPRKSVELLRTFGHDIITIQEVGKAGISDDIAASSTLILNTPLLL
ncbi:DUF5615 family PIN-like protein [Nostoc sp.]|uniref:DUF5615 family PIN-like protein n=1 Tax=Nostoc sp. TaxID=1180 RepID=UPI002FFBF361